MKPTHIRQAAVYAILTVSAAFGQSANPSIVISQVYGAGGNTGATYRNDYVELFNLSNASVNLTGLSIQYASATGTGTFGSNSITPLAGAIPPGGYYLVRMGSGGGTVGTATPAPDATGTQDMSAASGKLILASTTSGLACNGGSTPCSAAQLAQIIDLVGYGAANFFEGSGPAPSPSATQAIFRAGNGCSDTNNNAANFAAAAALARNSAAAVAPCSGGGISTNPAISGIANPATANPGDQITINGTITPGTNPQSAGYAVACDLSSIGGSTSAAASVNNTSYSLATAVSAGTTPGPKAIACRVTDNVSRTNSVTITLTVQSGSGCGSAATPISQVQGSGVASPLANTVVEVEGIVVGDFRSSTSGLGGFYLQEPLATQDNNALTSEGIFIYDNGQGAPVNLGDRVRVRGTVTEFVSSGSSLTEIAAVSAKNVCGSGNTVTPVSISLPVSSVADWERYEGMLVQITTPLVVSGNFGLGRFGQVDLAPSVLFQPTSIVSGTANWATQQDLNSRSLIALDDGSTLANANLYPTLFPQGGLSASNTLRVGARVNFDAQTSRYNPVTGILDDRFGAYRIEPTQPVTFDNGTNPRPDANVALSQAEVGGRFRLFNGNVLNFFTTIGRRGAATQAEYENQVRKISTELVRANADIYGLSEVQNFVNGNTNGGTYTNTAVQALVTAMNQAIGSNMFAFIDTINNPAVPATLNGTDAIRNVIIYKPASVTPVGNPALYYQNDTNRPALAQTFRPAAGARTSLQTFTFVVNHFRSRASACGGAQDDPFQGNCNGLRLNMAQNVANWLSTNPTGDPAGANRRVIVVGDFNAYVKEDPIRFLVGAGYTNLIESLIGTGGYSYNFGSQSGYIDHGFANSAALPLVKNLVEWHINADEPASLQAYNSASKSAAAQAAYYAANEFAASDHDPFVIGFNPLCGDLNDDGTVDTADQNILRNAIGRPKASVDRRTDFDSDGNITLTDFRFWAQCAAAYQR